jgi:NAD(P)-dependent dehydrogenase (short-subunit alcohol dehydrogenase family)
MAPYFRNNMMSVFGFSHISVYLRLFLSVRKISHNHPVFNCFITKNIFIIANAGNFIAKALYFSDRRQQPMKLKNKVAVITGGGTGIGKAIAARFAAEGASVVVAARTLSKLEETVNEIQAAGGRAKAVQVDVSDEKQVKEMAETTIREFGQIDVLVCNHAGGGGGGPVINLDIAGWKETLDINLTGTLLCCRAALQNMIPRRSGSIINISSVAGMYGVPGLASYSTSKWGVIGLTQTMAIEAGEYGIRVNSISPAATRTERFEEPQKMFAESSGITYEDRLKETTAHYALKRIAEPSETAGAALFLASDDSSAVTGHNLVVSCGFHAIHP